jgi:hypothetical protein
VCFDGRRPGAGPLMWAARESGRRGMVPEDCPVPAPDVVEDRGTPVWVWRDEHGWLSFWRMPGAVERYEISIPIGWRLRPDPDLGVVLADVRGNRLTAGAVFGRAEGREGGFRAGGRECLR